MTPQTRSKVVEKRIISATKEDWVTINSFLFNLQIQVPIYPFDTKRFINSNTGLASLSFDSLVKLSDGERFLIIQKLLNTFGLMVTTGEDGVSICSLNEDFSTEQFNVLDQVYKRYISSMGFKNQKSSVITLDLVELEGDLVLNEDVKIDSKIDFV